MPDGPRDPEWKKWLSVYCLCTLEQSGSVGLFGSVATRSSKASTEPYVNVILDVLEVS